MEKILAYDRRRQVVTLLTEHGPLSMRGLMACLNPPIQKKRLYEVIQRLLKLRFLDRRTYKGLGKSAFFYAVSKDPNVQSEVAQLTRLDLSVVKNPYFRRIELIHSENCAIWKEIFKYLFPSAKIIREHEFSNHLEVSQLLLQTSFERETEPDLILKMASYDNNSPVYIAVEIERNPKSKDRLVNKLRKYAAETRLDGVIYICETDALSERLRSVYNSIVLERALRIRQYGKNFILFTDGTLDPVTKTPFLFNADLDSIALNSWTNSLLKTKCVDRRNTHFASPGVCTGT